MSDIDIEKILRERLEFKERSEKLAGLLEEAVDVVGTDAMITSMGGHDASSGLDLERRIRAALAEGNNDER